MVHAHVFGALLSLIYWLVCRALAPPMEIRLSRAILPLVF